MTLRALLLSSLAALAIVSCGGGESNSSGGSGNVAGGIGGTGVSSGPVTGFGSVIVNGVEYNTSAATFMIDGVSAGSGLNGQSKLGVGMVVSVTHDGSGTTTSGMAKNVSFSDNVEGPVSSIVSATAFYVLGIQVTVSDLTTYAGGLISLADVQVNDIVEVSGNITGTNNVLATRVEKKTKVCGDGIEVKGTITAIVDANNFNIGALTVNYAAGTAPVGMKLGDYVEVTSTTCPSGTILIASTIHVLKPGPDTSQLDPGENKLEIKGVVAAFASTSLGCNFSVNGQAISAGTALCTSLADGKLVEVHGRLDFNSNILAATEISNEDASTEVTRQFRGKVTVDSQVPGSAFEGTIHIGSSATVITVNLNTSFEADATQRFDLNTLASPNSTTCAEVQVNSSNTAISIHKEDCQ